MATLLLPFVTPALIALLLAGSMLVIFNDWRVGVVALFAEYVAAAALLSQLVIPIVALVNLISGLLVVTILAITGWQLHFGHPAKPGEAAWQSRFAVPTALPFRLMAVVLAVVSALFISSQTQWILPGLDQTPAINAASYGLMTLGLLNLGLTEEPVTAGMGLLTLLLGFETFYAAVEPSLAVVALLAAVELAIALAVSYLATQQHEPGQGQAAS